MIEFNISKDFSEYPGARLSKVSEHSGEELANNHLIPLFKQSILNDTKLLINLDGTAGFAASFLDEAFGRLSLEFGYDKVINGVEFISKEETFLIDDIKEYMSEWYNYGPSRK